MSSSKKTFFLFVFKDSNFLLSELQRKKEETLNKILQLEKELDSKQKLQMEIQELKGKLKVMKHEDEDDEDIKKKMKEMKEQLEYKCSELQDLEETNSALMVKERQSNDEILEAREFLTTVIYFKCFHVLGC